MSKSAFADDLHIKGEVTSKGDIQLNGVADGEVSARTIWTKQNALIRGSVIADKVVLGGNIEGNVYGDIVKLESSAKVQGEVVSNSLSVDEEAYFNGISNHIQDSLKDNKLESK